MAIIDHVPGLQVEVIVDGRPLTEYDDDDDDDDGAEQFNATKYIEATSDKPFAIKAVFTQPFPYQHGVEMQVNIDGGQASSLVCRPEALYMPEGYCSTGIRFLKDGQSLERKYRFIALDIVEETDGPFDAACLIETLESKGLISVRFRFVTNIETVSQPKTTAPTEAAIANLDRLGAIPEKALKGDARSHQAGLGEPCVPETAHRVATCEYVDRNVIAVFGFKYRSLAALKALRVVNGQDMGGVALLPGDSNPIVTSNQSSEAPQSAGRREENAQSMKQEPGVARRMKREHSEESNMSSSDDEPIIIEPRSRKRARAEPEVVVLD